MAGILVAATPQHWTHLLAHPPPWHKLPRQHGARGGYKSATCRVAQLVGCLGLCRHLQSRSRHHRGSQVGKRGVGQASLIDGKAIAAEVKSEVRERASSLKSEHGVTPGLAVVLVGDRPDSASYVRSKTKAAEEVGCQVFNHRFAETVTEEELLLHVQKLNLDEQVHGILVQLPLPASINESRILGAIDSRKDADGLVPYNLGCLAQSSSGSSTEQSEFLAPCTPAGCMELLRRSDVELEGKDCVVLGRSSIVGLPMALLLTRANATVTICHSHTHDVAEVCGKADIIVAAVGKPGFVKGHWLKEGSVVLDVGINRVPDPSAKRGYRLVGDVDFASASQRVSKITPVPGGVGPMTVAMLLKNTVDLAARQVADR